MVAIPGPNHEAIVPTRLLTVSDYAALGETAWGYTELVEGRVLMSPSPPIGHAHALSELAIQLHEQLPAELAAIMNLDIDLELAPPDKPGFSRRPDLIVIEQAVGKRVSRDGGMVRAADVLLVVELVFPDAHRIDTVDKRREYRDAGIEHYWIVDVAEPITLFIDDQAVTGTFRTETPFPFEINLDRLR